MATITTDADKVIRVDEARAWLLHVEFQSSREPFLDLRVARYKIILDEAAYRA